MAEKIPGAVPPKKGEPALNGEDALKARIAALEAELEASKSAEEKANDLVARGVASAQNQALFGPANTEVLTREDEDGDPIYAYRIDLPPSGGEFIRINGEPFYHGVTYEFGTDRLRSVKEIVFRSWAHEATIQGSNENAYRKPKDLRIGGRH